MIPSLKGRNKEIQSSRFSLNRRQRKLITSILAAILLFSVVVVGALLDEERIATNLIARNLAPSFAHLFGTDWLGRDMFARTIMGLSLSVGVGLIGAIGSTSIALMLGMAAATMGRVVDLLISWLIDLFLSVPHLVTLILIAFTLGGGFKGIVIGLMLTHWPSTSSGYTSRSHANSISRICPDLSADGEI